MNTCVYEPLKKDEKFERSVQIRKNFKAHDEENLASRTRQKSRPGLVIRQTISEGDAVEEETLQLPSNVVLLY